VLGSYELEDLLEKRYILEQKAFLNDVERFSLECGLYKICGFHGGDYEEWRHLGCYAA
jgi:hypothetical protein